MGGNVKGAGEGGGGGALPARDDAGFDAAQVALLERVACGHPLPELLADLVRLIEHAAGEMLCSILLVDDTDDTLRHGAAPNLPASYMAVLDHTSIGPNVGSCGAAAFTRRRVVVESIADDPRWARFRRHALAAGLLACWSTPIFSAEAEVLGTFAMYYRERRGPTPREEELVSRATHLAAIAILRDRSEARLRASEARARQLTRLYDVSSSVGEALVRFRSADELYAEACRIAVEKGLAALAWFGLYDARADRIVPVARYGRDEGYIDGIELRLEDPNIERGPAAIAIATGAPAVSNDIATDPTFHWKDAALSRGLRACAAFPFEVDGQPGVFVIYGDAMAFFHDEELKVLRALSENIAFAVHSAKTALARETAESQLRHNEALLRIAGHAARLGGWRVDLAGEHLTWSDEVGTILESPPGVPAEVREVFAFVAPEARDLARAKIEACLGGGIPFDLELPMVTRTGRRIAARVIGLPVRGADGHVVGLEGALQDVSERQQLEDQLRQAQKMEAVGRLASGVAHDFNNLLSVILGYAVYVEQELREGDPLRDEVAEIRRAGERAGELTRQLLAFGRQQVLMPRVIDLNAVVSSVDRMLRRLVSEDVTIAIHGDAALGSVFADPGQVELVLVNLVMNARDAMPAGGALTIETANVELDSTYAKTHHPVVPGPYVVLAVTDTGQGMNEETRSRVFEPFFTTKERGRGTGLGLAMVYGIVTQSRGYVWVYSEPGAGTSIKVYFPRVDGRAQPLESAPVPTTLHGTETILLVEDVDEVRNILRSVLCRNGYSVLMAENGDGALAVASSFEGKIDLLLTDVVMPRLGGPELAARIATVRPETKVLYMSGYAEEAVFQHGMLGGGAAFLEKPITPDSLLRKVRQVLETSRGG